MRKFILSTCWNVDHGRQTPGWSLLQVLAYLVLDLAPGILHLKNILTTILVLQVFGIYSKRLRPKTKDLQPAKNELACCHHCRWT